MMEYQEEISAWNRKQESFWFAMNGHLFEKELARVLESRGYSTTVTRGSGDGGIDVVARMNGTTSIIQCKAWANAVGPATIREIVGVRNAGQEAWVVGLGGFTSGARAFAREKGVRLLDVYDVIALAQGQ